MLGSHEGGRNKALSYLGVVIVILSLGYAVYAQTQLNSFKADPTKVSKEEQQQLVKEVGEHMVLPTNEEPTIATVNKPELLKDQPFFANAQVGFKVLIYSAAKKAILYDPVAKKIVDVAPVNIGASTKTTSVKK